MVIAIICIFIAYIGFREWLFYVHVKDLEVKLMARDSQEYAVIKGIDKPTRPVKTEPEDEMVDPFEVDPNDALKGLGVKDE